MELKQKRQRLQNIIKRIREIMESDDMNLILSDKDLKILEALLNIKPYSKKNSKDEKRETTKRISGKGFKRKKASSDNRF